MHHKNHLLYCMVKDDFYDKNLEGVTFVIDSSKNNIPELGDKIYNLYHNLLISLDKNG